METIELVGGPEDGRVYEVATLEPYIRVYATSVMEAPYLTRDSLPAAESIPLTILFYEPELLGARIFDKTWLSRNDKGNVVYKYKGTR
jgi:hypothetical protein